MKLLILVLAVVIAATVPAQAQSNSARAAAFFRRVAQETDTGLKVTLTKSQLACFQSVFPADRFRQLLEADSKFVKDKAIQMCKRRYPQGTGCDTIDYKLTCNDSGCTLDLTLPKEWKSILPRGSVARAVFKAHRSLRSVMAPRGRAQLRRISACFDA